MKTASSHTFSINLPALAQLPDEFKFVSATEYHRLVHLHATYRKEAADIAISALRNTLSFASPHGTSFGGRVNCDPRMVTRATMEISIVDVIMKGTPIDYRSLTRALKTDHGIDVDADHIENDVRDIICRINMLDLTV